jgi:two-component system, cell cycle sensor histidine kinase and response regulator CckA
VRVRKDGSKIDVSLTVSPIRDEAGAVTQICVLAHDITERKKKEQKLQEFERVVEGVEEMIAVVDREYRYVIANQAFLRYRGVTKEQVIGKRVAEILGPEVFEESIKERLDECFKGKVVRFDLQYPYPELGKRDLFISYFPIEGAGGVSRVACILQDITQRKQAEEALRESEARERAKSKELETVLDTVPVSVFIARDIECSHMTTNRTGYEELRQPIGANVSRSALLPKLSGFRIMRDGIEVPTEQLPMQRAAATARPVYGVPLSLLFEDGTERHTLCNAVPLLGEDGTPTGVVGASIDVTERKRAEDALRERERTQELILDHLSVGVILSSVGEEKALYQNPRFRELFGHSIESVADWWPLAYPDPAYREWVFQEWQRHMTEAARTGGEIEPMEVTITCHDGTKKYVRVLAKVIGDLNFITFIDLSERRRAEEALRKSEEKFSKAFQQSPMVLTLTSTKDHRYIEVNETFERVTGWRRDEVIGRTPFDIGFWVHPAQRVELTKRLLTEGGLRNVEACFRMRDGSVRIGLATAEVIELNGEPCMLAVTADITERKQAEEALQRSEQNYRMFVAQSSEGIFREDLDSPISIDLPEEEIIHQILHGSYMAECNDALAKTYGFASGRHLTGKRLTEMLVATDPANVQLTRDFIRSGFQIRDRESHEVDSQGNLKVFLNSMTGIVENGKLMRTWGIQRDITEWVRLEEARTKTEAALRRAEFQYRTIFEEAVVGIFQTTPEGVLLVANPALARMFGYESAPEFIARVNAGSRPVYDPESRQKFIDTLRRSGNVRDFEVQVYRKDGTVMLLSVSARVVYEHGVAVSHEGMCEDVTERKLLQKRLLQAQKMEAVGSLAAGIAHDFNNVLGVILGQGELLLEKLSTSDASHRRVEQICQAGKRAASLTEQLLAFSRQQILQPTTLDLNRVVENFSNMIASLIGEDVRMVRVLGPALAPVSADAGQMEQVLMNLVVNARDAMPQGGTITIRTSNVELDEAFARQHAGAKPGPSVMLTVSDTGIGMDEQTAARAFDPFFTTKEVGKGTGLGLSTVYGIVKQSSGYISVDSDLGKGTTFTIYLPRVEEAATVENRDKTPAPPMRGSETILLVEDAVPLREVTREFLREAGYTVLEADDASQALETAEHYSAEISLLITDVVLPGINGHALAERLISLRPGTRVLYIS